MHTYTLCPINKRYHETQFSGFRGVVQNKICSLQYSIYAPKSSKGPNFPEKIIESEFYSHYAYLHTVSQIPTTLFKQIIRPPPLPKSVSFDLMIRACIQFIVISCKNNCSISVLCYYFHQKRGIHITFILACNNKNMMQQILRFIQLFETTSKIKT